MSQKLEEILKKRLGNSFTIYSSKPLVGGDINSVFKLNTSVGPLCIKMNDAKKYPLMFRKEADGLELLKQHSSFAIPLVLCTGEVNDQAFLLMSFIDSTHRKQEYWSLFGERLANMHRSTQSQFGLGQDNFIGSLIQKNDQQDNWIDFYFLNRILFQLEQGISTGLFSSADAQNATKLYHQLNSILPIEKPALLHGDLWSGNVMVDEKGYPALIDPAIYYGHREMDLAMTQLFGGFDRSMYEAYHSTYPLEKNWEERIEIHNLYPLLVHANLFKGGYVQQVKTQLKKYK